jgi:hypothetical protein
MYGLYNQEVHRLLIEAAKGNRQPVTYDEIKGLTGNLKLFGDAWSGQLGRILYDIIENDRAADPSRPLLSVMAVGANGTPGFGLYTLARELGELKGRSELDELRYWSEQVKAVQAYWQDKPNPFNEE